LATPPTPPNHPSSLFSTPKSAVRTSPGDGSTDEPGDGANDDGDSQPYGMLDKGCVRVSIPCRLVCANLVEFECSSVSLFRPRHRLLTCVSRRKAETLADSWTPRGSARRPFPNIRRDSCRRRVLRCAERAD
jgi:hypothetical protein